jgi:hypothetical protein
MFSSTGKHRDFSRGVSTVNNDVLSISLSESWGYPEIDPKIQGLPQNLFADASTPDKNLNA